jgi:phosphogluconate dehydratase
LDGPLGRGVVKVSALKTEHRVVEAPARIFERQEDFLDAFRAGELEDDAVVVVRFQGPKANGMPELHRLTPALGVLQDRGHKVALVTDGRMSGASGKVPAAVHCTPEAAEGGPLARLRDGDMIRFDTITDTLEVVGVDLSTREPVELSIDSGDGTGRELFQLFRETVGGAEAGASVFAV